jgi:molybdopterin molybdotransferase
MIEKSTDRLARIGSKVVCTWRASDRSEASPMISFPESLEILLRAVSPLGVESCPLENSVGRVLREGVTADRDFPAFDRVMMDGYAMRFSDWEAGLRSFAIKGSAPAGSPRATLDTESASCLEIMTGAPCPVGADCIIPVEDSEMGQAGWVKFSESASPVSGRFIHRAGSDAAAGDLLLETGTLLGSREIGVAASCGAAVLQVSALPKIAVVATGDELVAVHEIPAAHQIRQSNAHSLAAALARAGFPAVEIAVLKDDAAAARASMARHLAENDFCVLTGAVSMGARDFVPRLLDELGCKKLFHGVAHRPGKPAGCWLGPRGQLVFALPGNPVSALTGLHTFVLPCLAAASGLKSPPRRLVTLEDPNLQLPDFTRHLPVTLRADGRAEAAMIGNSGDFIGLLKSTGFVTLPPRGSAAVAFPFTPWL